MGRGPSGSTAVPPPPLSFLCRAGFESRRAGLQPARAPCLAARARPHSFLSGPAIARCRVAACRCAGPGAVVATDVRRSHQAPPLQRASQAAAASSASIMAGWSGRPTRQVRGALAARAPGPTEPGEPGMRRARAPASIIVRCGTADRARQRRSSRRPPKGSSVRGGLLLSASRSPFEQTTGVDCRAGASSTDDDRSPASGLAARRQA